MDYCIKNEIPVFPGCITPSEVKFMPAGGVNARNLKDYLSCDKIVCCGGSWMVKSDLVKAASNELVVSFKNLIIEAYCRDSSVKIRSCLEIKRRNGDFIGSFAVYGYLKDPQNKNHLVVDGFAADVGVGSCGKRT